MWIVIKYKNNNQNFFIKNFKKKFKENFIFYNPKLKIEKFCKNKIVSNEVDLIKNYIFCYSKNFKDQSYLNTLMFTKGLSYILDGYQNSQDEIKNFINKCKNFENENGYLSANFFDLQLNKKYRFKSGPFLNHIFRVIEINKKRFKITMGNKIHTVRNNYLLNAL
jgi:hypothetical protein